MRKRVALLMLVSFFLIFTMGFGILGCAQPKEEAFPTQDIHFVVAAEPGGGYDAYARALAPYLKKNLTGNTNIVVENKPGGGGIIGLTYVYKSQPDGYTFAFASLPGDIATSLVSEVSYDLKKVSWIGTLVQSEFVFYVHAKSPINSFEELVAEGKKKQLKGAPPRIGDTATLQLVIVGEQAGLNYKMIGGYESGKGAMLGLVRGDMDFMITAPGGYADDFIKSGDVKPILTTGAGQSPFYPNVKYAGQVGYSVPVWNRMIFAPPGTPENRVQVLESAFQKSCQDPEFLAWSKKTGNVVGWIGAKESAKMAADSYAAVDKYRDLLKQALTAAK